MDNPMAHGCAERRTVINAMMAVRALFADTSVDKQQTYRDLTALQEEIEVMKDSLFP